MSNHNMLYGLCMHYRHLGEALLINSYKISYIFYGDIRKISVFRVEKKKKNTLFRVMKFRFFVFCQSGTCQTYTDPRKTYSELWYFTTHL